MTSEAFCSAGVVLAWLHVTDGAGMTGAACLSFPEVVGFVLSVFSMFSYSQPTGLPAGTHSAGFRHLLLSPLTPWLV